MAERRKSKAFEKGKVLKDGESERPKEGRFVFRYKDRRVKTRSLSGSLMLSLMIRLYGKP